MQASMQWAANAARFTLVEPLRAALANAPQALINLAGAFMVAQFAMHGGVLPQEVAYPLAVGVEWTYLRGLASAGRTTSSWGDGLNYAAFGTSFISGLLWALIQYDALPAEPTGWQAFWLALAHVAPVSLLALCAAMVHRAAGRGEAEAASTVTRERARLALLAERRTFERQQLAADEEVKLQAEAARREMEDETRQRAATQEIEAEKQKALARLAYRQERVKFDTPEASVNLSKSAPQSATTRLSKVERLDSVLALIGQVGGLESLDVSAAAARLHVSRQTIYNDIKALQEAGRL